MNSKIYKVWAGSLIFLNLICGCQDKRIKENLRLDEVIADTSYNLFCSDRRKIEDTLNSYFSLARERDEIACSKYLDGPDNYGLLFIFESRYGKRVGISEIKELALGKYSASCMVGVKFPKYNLAIFGSDSYIWDIQFELRKSGNKWKIASAKFAEECRKDFFLYDLYFGWGIKSHINGRDYTDLTEKFGSLPKEY